MGITSFGVVPRTATSMNRPVPLPEGWACPIIEDGKGLW